MEEIEQHGRAEPFSDQEAVAMALLETQGFDQIPVFIGRARRELRLAGKNDPTAKEILGEVQSLVKLDQEQRLYLERRAREKFLAEVATKICLSEADRVELASFIALFRELVELERIRFLLAHPKALSGVSEKTRTTLYPDKIPRPGTDPSFAGALRLGQSTFKIRAWVGKDFINLEFTLESGATKTL